MSRRWNTSGRVTSLDVVDEKLLVAGSVEKRFRSVFIAMKVIDIWPINSTNRVLQAAHQSYSVVLVLLLAYILCVRFGSISVASNYTVLLVTIQLWSVETLLIVVHFMIAARWTSLLPGFYGQLEEFWKSQQEAPRPKTRKVTVGLWVFVVLATILFLGTVFVQQYPVGGDDDDDDDKSLSNPSSGMWIYPFNSNQTAGATIEIILSTFAMFYGVNACLFTVVHFIIVCALLTEELESINQSLANGILADGSVVDGVIEKLRRRHDQVTALVACADRVLGIYVAIVFASFIPSFCIAIEDAVFSNFNMGIRLSLCEWWFMQTVIVSAMSTFAVRLSLQAHDASTHLYRVDMNQLDSKQIQPYNTFLVRLNGPAIGLSAWGTMTITKETLLAFLGTIVTYVVFVVELHRA